MVAAIYNKVNTYNKAMALYHKCEAFRSIAYMILKKDGGFTDQKEREKK